MVNYVRAYRYLHDMLSRAYWPAKKLADYQDLRLRSIVEYAYENVPFYRSKFKEANVRPGDVRTLDDLRKLPIVAKDDVRRNSALMISKEYNVSQLKMLRTSGSTGEPLYFYISGSEDEFRKTRHLRANIACGQKARDRWVTITSPIYFRQATRLQQLLRVYSPFSISVFDDVATQIRTIEKMKPDVLDGYASSLLLLAREIEKRTKNEITPKFLISGADLIGVDSRKFVEKVFRVPFYDQYGAAEFERLAWQCKEKSGYHIDADSVIIEFIDQNGEEVAPGEKGEIVCTSLFNYAMPFLRYAVGDVGSASRETACPCGRTFPLMRVFEGRVDESIVLPDGRSMSSFALIAVMYRLSFYKEIERFRIVQKKSNYLKFLIKMRTKIGKESIEKELLEVFSSTLRLRKSEVQFEVELVDEISVDKSGKFRIVFSEVETRQKMRQP